MTHEEAGVPPVAGLAAEAVVAAADEAAVGVAAGPVGAAGGVAQALVDVDLRGRSHSILTRKTVRNMDLGDFCTIVGDEELSRQYLRANHLLPDSPACTEIACQATNVRMRLNRHRNDRQSQYVWR